MRLLTTFFDREYSSPRPLLDQREEGVFRRVSLRFIITVNLPANGCFERLFTIEVPHEHGDCRE